MSWHYLQGGGGGILGGILLGWNTIGAVEIEPSAREILLARQRDGFLPRFPIWDDVRTFDGKPWRGLVDVVSGGFPCQDISCAGKGAGINGTRSGLWSEMCRIIGEVRPRFAFLENSPMLSIRGLDRVLADLAEIGYNAQWQTLSAAAVGAPHRRERIWILAADGNSVGMADANLPGAGRRSAQPREIAAFIPDAHSLPSPEQKGTHTRPKELAGSCTNQLAARRDVANADSVGRNAMQVFASGEREPLEKTPTGEPLRTVGIQGSTKRDFLGNWWKVEPKMGRVADGVAHRMDRLRALGNGQVPLVAATAFILLLERFKIDFNHA